MLAHGGAPGVLAICALLMHMHAHVLVTLSRSSNTNANQVPPGHLLNRCRLHKTRNRLRSAGLSLLEFPSTRTKVVNSGPFSKKIASNHIINKFFFPGDVNYEEIFFFFAS